MPIMYGPTRYSMAFFVNGVHVISFHSDIAPPRYDPGEYLRVYDWKDAQGRFIMTQGPYRILRTEHAIDWEAPQGWAAPERFWVYVYVVRERRGSMVLEGLRTIVSALFSAAPRPTPQLPREGGLLVRKG